MSSCFKDDELMERPDKFNHGAKGSLINGKMLLCSDAYSECGVKAIFSRFFFYSFRINKKCKI